MTKSLLKLCLIILLVTQLICGCVTQNDQNNNTNPEDIISPTIPTMVRWMSAETDITPTFRWNASTDSSGIAGYYVKIDEDEWIWIGNNLTWESPSIIADGSHQFYVKAKDASINGNTGAYGSCSFFINTTTVKIPPVAYAQGPYSGYKNQSIIFDGSNSFDVDGYIVNYTWDLGDGTILYGINVSHIYREIGIYTISLTVEDNETWTHTNTTFATIFANPDDAETQGNDTDGSTIEQEQFLGSWHNETNAEEHWIFYNNWTQKQTIRITNSTPGESYILESWFDYTVNTSMLCQIPLIEYSGEPSCFRYEFSGNNQVLTLSYHGAIRVVLIKD